MKIRGFCAQNRLKEQLLFTTNNNNQLIKIQEIVMREHKIGNKIPFNIILTKSGIILLLNVEQLGLGYVDSRSEILFELKK